jgi:hypothetical protein
MRMRGIKALAAAASLAVLAIGSQAKATTDFTLNSGTMDQTYDAYVTGFGWAIANGVTFQVTGYPTGETSLFGFCIDIYHDMYVNTPLNLTYTTNQPTGGGLVPNTGTSLANKPGDSNLEDPANQISDITNLVDTGFLLHAAEDSSNYADTEARLAAIQVAIWDVAVPGTVTNLSGGDTALFSSYVGYYTSSTWTTLATPSDKVFTITEGGADPGGHQSFAVGWPVPEPATWAMMLVGFGGMGAVLRRSRKAAAATA